VSSPYAPGSGGRIALFGSGETARVGRRVHELDSLVPHVESQLEEAEPAARDEIAQLLKELKTEQNAARRKLNEEFKPLRQELARLEAEGPFGGIPTAYAVADSKPVDAPLQKNGDPESLENVVPRGVPAVLDAGGLEIPAGTSGRLVLARWMTEKAGFLTARVMVNRIWQQHFGKPLVATPSDFGFRGTPPTHPELLDWLANEFIASGWSIKRMHRLIMLSKTYGLSSELDGSDADVDGGNAWYWRFDRRRLDAESLRDTILSLGGSLDLTRPGPHPFPERSTWRFSAHNQFNKVSYPSDHRSVYLMVQRLHAHPYLSLFNGADPSLSTPQRDVSTVSLQALFLLNNPMIHTASSGFAKSLLAAESNAEARLRLAFVRAYARPPSETELQRALSFLKRYEESLAEEGADRSSWELESWSALARTMLASNSLFYVD